MKSAGGRSATARLIFLIIFLCPPLWSAESEDRAVYTPGIAPPAVWGIPLGKASLETEKAMAELGRHLFFEPRLSANGCVSCATCHQPQLAFTDGLSNAVGIYGDKHPRNTPTLTNIAYAASFAWIDAGIESLEQQAKVPMFNVTPPEMGLVDETDATAKIKDDPAYQSLFKHAFPDQEQPITLAYIQKSLAAFERTLISYQSPFDRYVYAGEHDALSDGAKRGMRLFYSRRLGCVTCHHSWNLSGPIRTETEPTTEPTFHNTGLPLSDGVAARQQQESFKTPTLRNVAVTAPYMHDGSLKTLEDVIKHYEAGGQGVAKSGLLRQFTLDDGQRADLVEFMEHLTDQQFIQQAIHSDPNPDLRLPPHCSNSQSDTVASTASANN